MALLITGEPALQLYRLGAAYQPLDRYKPTEEEDQARADLREQSAHAPDPGEIAQVVSRLRDLGAIDVGTPLPLIGAAGCTRNPLVSVMQDRSAFGRFACRPLELGGDVEPLVWIPTPGMLLLHLCATLSQVEAFALACEFAGFYSFFADVQAPDPEDEWSSIGSGKPGFWTRDRPLTTKEDLRNSLAPVPPRHRGIRLCRWAVSQCFERAASPMETVGGGMMCLPIVLGGMQLSRPELNVEVVLDESGQLLADQMRLIIDYYWRAPKVGVEYDSDQEHFGKDNVSQQKRDRHREEAARTGGIELHTLTSDVLKSPRRFAAFCHTVADAIGQRIDHRPPLDCTKMKGLYQELQAFGAPSLHVSD